jgi:hypothetical protein
MLLSLRNIFVSFANYHFCFQDILKAIINIVKRACPKTYSCGLFINPNYVARISVNRKCLVVKDLSDGKKVLILDREVRDRWWLKSGCVNLNTPLLLKLLEEY